MKKPAWYGIRYPSLQDFEAYAASIGVGVGYADVPMGLFFPAISGVPVTVIPESFGLLEMIWCLAHELGHAVQHSGPKGELSYSKEETQASRWAACALIPEARIQAYGNASLDAFIGALSAHYEDLPLRDCPARRLAAHIAMIRLRAVEEVA